MEKSSTKITKNVQSYIELVYSEKSELNHIADLEERKRTACEKAKLDYDDQKTQDIIHMKNEVVNDEIHKRLTQNSNEFVLLVADQHLFWEIQQKQMKPLVESSDADTVLKDLELKTKMSVHSKALLLRIREGYQEVFKGEEEAEVGVQKIRMLRPEERLKQKTA